jgi:hypothetical protein
VGENTDNPDWKLISEKKGDRTRKQCQERWEEHLRNDIDQSDISEEEDLLILQVVFHDSNASPCNRRDWRKGGLKSQIYCRPEEPEIILKIIGTPRSNRSWNNMGF